MAENQAMSPDSGIVANHNRLRRIDESQLHNLAVAPHHKPGIRVLQATNEDLLVDLRVFADLHVGSVQKGHRTDLDMAPYANFFSTNDGQEADRGVISHLYLVPAKH